jgi:hypothetical protein
MLLLAVHLHTAAVGGTRGGRRHLQLLPVVPAGLPHLSPRCPHLPAKIPNLIGNDEHDASLRHQLDL